MEPKTAPIISDRRYDESLHDYLIRKNIKCFCKSCRYKDKIEAEKNNTTIV